MKKHLPLYLSVVIGIALCIAFVDRPLATLIHTRFYETRLFSLTSAALHASQALLAVLVIALVFSSGWRTIGRAAPPWVITPLQSAIAAFVALAAALALKFAMGRSQVYPGYLVHHIAEWRPFHGGIDNSAFPSGYMAITAGALSVLWMKVRPWRTVFVLLLMAAALAILITNGHWLSDLLAGAALGWYVGTRVARVRMSSPELNAQP